MTISFEIIERGISNTYFLIGFFTTLYYWSQIVLTSKPVLTDQNWQTVERTRPFRLIKNIRLNGFLGFFLINLLLTIQLLSRWYISGHFPLSTLYESLLFLAWGVTIGYLIVEYTLDNEFIGMFIAPFILCLLAFTEFSLPGDLQQTKPLVPALQSNWLFMHVSVMILSYAALLIGSILSITYLIIYLITKEHKQDRADRLRGDGLAYMKPVGDKLPSTEFVSEFVSNSNTPMPTVGSPNSAQMVNEQMQNTFDILNLSAVQSVKNTRFSDFLRVFDNFAYRSIGIGFCFLTLGILSGAVWANETWGSYWSWDPKETWALITWLTFAVYLHVRLVYDWQGFKPASIASLGFLIIWICYLGVNLLGKGLHSYGFF
jgi:cytochrome c-type biogenesis protein CcsB